MLSLHQIIMIYAAIQAFQSGRKSIKWSANPIFLFMTIINLIAEILTQVFMAYKFPLLFVSWMIITDPFYQRLLTRLLEKLKNE